MWDHRACQSIVSVVSFLAFVLSLPLTCTAAESSPRDVLFERLRSSLPSGGCVEASYVVDPEAMASPSHSQRRIKYDVTTHQVFVATHRDIAIADSSDVCL